MSMNTDLEYGNKNDNNVWTIIYPILSSVLHKKNMAIL